MSDSGGTGADDIEPTLGQRTVVAGREDKIFSAFTSIGSRRTEIGDPAPPGVVDRAERLGRRLEHHRPLGEIEDAHEIDGVRIGRQEQRLRIHQFGEDQDLVILDPNVEKALAGWRPCSHPAGCSRTPRRRA